jgi:hypothetical protein
MRSAHATSRCSRPCTGAGSCSSSSDGLRWLHTQARVPWCNRALRSQPSPEWILLAACREYLSSSCVCAQLAARSGQSFNRPPGPDVNQGTGPGPRFRRIECPLGDGGGARSPVPINRPGLIGDGPGTPTDSDGPGARSPTGFERQSGTAAAGGPAPVPGQIEDGPDATDRDVRLGVTARALSKTPALATEPLPARH